MLLVLLVLCSLVLVRLLRPLLTLSRFGAALLESDCPPHLGQYGKVKDVGSCT